MAQGIEVPILRFPRWRVFWRTWFRTEDALSALPMAIATPTVGALSGTAWAVSHPSEVVRDGVVVLVRQSFLDALLPALVGGAVAVSAVAGIVFAVVWLRYRVAGNPVWEAAHGGSHQSPNGPSLIFFDLRRKGSLPCDPATLGAIECVAKTPSGTWWSSSGRGMLVPRGNPEGFVVHTPLTFEPGSYDVRWYATEHRSTEHEVARTEIRVVGDPRAGNVYWGRSGPTWRRIVRR